MKYREFGETGIQVSEISLGTWQLGGKWGADYNEETAQATLETAFEQGINFFDTADGYNNGESEKSIGRFIKGKQGKVFVATKCGRQINPHVAAGYTREAVVKYTEESLKRMDVDSLDLIQLHCPPTDVFYKPEVFEALQKLKKEGKIRHFGVSVERVEEGLKAMEYEGMASIQVIYNMFRQRPHELLFPQARKKGVAIIVRVPLASGLLTGKFTADSVFGKQDHRFFNRKGEEFDKGETFSGVDYDLGLKAVAELKEVFGENNLTLNALRWILMRDEVSCVITGASRPEQIKQNVAASDMPALTDEQMAKVRAVYDKYIRNPVHYLW
ncbi:MAG: aldo/keto reductase [Eubacteriales bacterium]|nr:aldo/keto reductase [Eubacteriales bacterium]